MDNRAVDVLLRAAARRDDVTLTHLDVRHNKDTTGQHDEADIRAIEKFLLEPQGQNQWNISGLVLGGRFFCFWRRPPKTPVSVFGGGGFLVPKTSKNPYYISTLPPAMTPAVRSGCPTMTGTRTMAGTAARRAPRECMHSTNEFLEVFGGFWRFLEVFSRVFGFWASKNPPVFGGSKNPDLPKLTLKFLRFFLFPSILKNRWWKCEMRIRD